MERDHMSVIGDHEHAIAQNGHAAVDAARRVAGQALAARAFVVPDLAARGGVERPSGIHVGDVYDAFHYHRSHFQMARIGDRENPARRELTDIAWRNLVERAETVAAQLAVISGPVARLRLDDAVPDDGAGKLRRGARLRFRARKR